MIVINYSKKNILEIFLQTEVEIIEYCIDCDGTGEIPVVCDDEVHQEDCFYCEGTGKVKQIEEKLIGTCFSNADEHGKMLQYVLEAAKIPYTVR